jgi:hypothetical protein
MRFSIKLALSAQPGERYYKFSPERQKFWSRGHLLRKTPPKGISSQNTLLNNLSPVQPILTCNTPINSARHAETREIIKKFSNPFLGEQSGNFEKSSLLTYEPFDRFSPIDSAKQGKQNEIIKIFKISF